MNKSRDTMSLTSGLSLETSVPQHCQKQQDPQAPEVIKEINPKEKSRRLRGECSLSASTSHTQYFKRDKYERDMFNRITTDEFCGLTESMSGSSDTFRCFHKEGKQCTGKGLLKRTLTKKFDSIPKNEKAIETCPPVNDWGIAEKLEFLVKDPMGVKQVDRLQEYLRDFAKLSSNGYISKYNFDSLLEQRIDILDRLAVVLEYLVESMERKVLYCRTPLAELLKNIEKPILLIVNTDILTKFDMLRGFIAYLGYLLLSLEDDELFTLVSKGLLYQLSAADEKRGPGSVKRRHMETAAQHVLTDTVVRMIAIAPTSRYSTFLQLAFLLACNSVDNCLDLMMGNILESLFYRFNPYFPDRDLPVYDINPCDTQDFNVKLGASSICLQNVLSLLLVLVKTIKEFLDKNPNHHKIFPYPDENAQRCFVWAYRYECRAIQHKHQRNSLTVIANMLIHIFGEKLTIFSNSLMPDVMALSVLTEIPPRDDWTRTVNFSTLQEDVVFKRLLIHLSVDFLKIYPHNKFMAAQTYWAVGLMYLVDPGLSSIKRKWKRLPFAELRNTALKALVVSTSLIPPDLPAQLSLIRRIMWYMEWYTENPFDMTVLYWCVRLLLTTLHERSSPFRKPQIRELFQSHGVIILINLCFTLLDRKAPPLERTQSIIALNLRVLTSCLEYKAKVSCFVYPTRKWPRSIVNLIRKTMLMMLFALEKRSICSDKWLLSVLNFLWESIIWKKEYRESFVRNDGIYKLLDIIALSRYPVQCLALALVCDVLRSGEGVCQVITWRASAKSQNAQPVLVQPGASIGSLLAALCYRDCLAQEIRLDENNVLQDLNFPLMSDQYKKFLFSREYIEETNQKSSLCLAAVEVAGTRMAKCFAILQMLSEDLNEKVALADEAYNLYKNVKLPLKDEVMLVLCAHYLTIKHNEAWLEGQVQGHGYIPVDNEILCEFLHISRNWTKYIQQMQIDVTEKFKARELNEENNLYSFLERVRLNVALDALREVRCTARSTDRNRIVHALIFEAVQAYQRRSIVSNQLKAPVVQTYEPPIDDAVADQKICQAESRQPYIFMNGTSRTIDLLHSISFILPPDENMIGQNVKIISIQPKDKPKKRDIYLEEEKLTSELSEASPSHEFPGEQEGKVH